MSLVLETRSPDGVIDQLFIATVVGINGAEWHAGTIDLVIAGNLTMHAFC
jgi:hypothetical protein